MNYQKLIKGLFDEAKEGIQYKNMTVLFRILTVIAMSPVLVVEFCLIAAYYVLNFIFNALVSPVEYLEAWQKGKKDEVQHATQAVVYLVSTPTIFFFRVMLSLASFFYYILWFMLMTCTFILTLAGVRWQPYLTLANFDKKYKWELNKYETLSQIFTIVALCVLTVCIIFFLITRADPTIIHPMVSKVFWGIYLVIVCIANPIIFRKKEIIEEECAE